MPSVEPSSTKINSTSSSGRSSRSTPSSGRAFLRRIVERHDDRQEGAHRASSSSSFVSVAIRLSSNARKEVLAGQRLLSRIAIEEASAGAAGPRLKARRDTNRQLLKASHWLVHRGSCRKASASNPALSPIFPLPREALGQLRASLPVRPVPYELGDLRKQLRRSGSRALRQLASMLSGRAESEPGRTR